MKKLLLFALTVCFLASCGNKQNNDANNSTDSTAVASNYPTYGLDSLLSIANQFVDKTVIVRGSVTHTCKHAGKRCFIVGENENVTMRVEAKGNIGGFNRELIGSELAITGVVKERRVSKDQIDEMEKGTNSKKKSKEASEEECHAELSNINTMREWMKANGKDYYAIYFMDGQEYEVVENK